MADENGRETTRKVCDLFSTSEASGEIDLILEKDVQLGKSEQSSKVGVLSTYATELNVSFLSSFLTFQSTVRLVIGDDSIR